MREKMYIRKSNSNSVLGKTVSHLLMLYRSGFGEFAVSLSSPQNTSSSYNLMHTKTKIGYNTKDDTDYETVDDLGRGSHLFCVGQRCSTVVRPALTQNG